MKPSSSAKRPSVASAPPGSESWQRPWVQMKYFTYHPCVYGRFLGSVSKDAGRGSLVAVYDKDGQRFGTGLYNPGAKVPLRMLHHGAQDIDEAWLEGKIRLAATLRTETLRLDAISDAYRVIHSDGDGLSGLIVDRYADVLRVDVHSFGIWQRVSQWMPLLHEMLGTKREIIAVDPEIARIESIPAVAVRDTSGITSVKIKEHGVRYGVNFASGHKTGFFCDQRENRRRLAEFAEGKSVLDLCCYTGGFSLAAKVLGKAAEVTGVDLDENAIAQARQNANLNQARINWVHTDAFKYARQMQQNGKRWDIVVLDPPKLVFTREDEHGGRRKYEDLNRLAVTLVESGGLFVTCSCSGMVSAEEFQRIVIKAAHREGKKLQFIQQTGPGPDHPVMSNCLESHYLKVLWARVW